MKRCLALFQTPKCVLIFLTYIYPIGFLAVRMSSVDFTRTRFKLMLTSFANRVCYT